MNKRCSTWLSYKIQTVVFLVSILFLSCSSNNSESYIKKYIMDPIPSNIRGFRYKETGVKDSIIKFSFQTDTETLSRILTNNQLAKSIEDEYNGLDRVAKLEFVRNVSNQNSFSNIEINQKTKLYVDIHEGRIYYIVVNGEKINMVIENL